MADPVTIGLAAFSVGSSIMGGIGAKKAAKDAAKEQVKLTAIQREEERRQMIRAAKQELGAGRAAIGASNLQFSGSAQRYLNNLDFENMREIAQHRFMQKKEAEAIKAGAQGVGTPFFAQAAGDAIGYAAQAYGNRALSAPSSVSNNATGSYMSDTSPFAPAAPTRPAYVPMSSVVK